jgi:hypothetical protein
VSVEKKLQLTPNLREPINFIGSPRGHFIFFVYIYTNIIAKKYEKFILSTILRQKG